MNTPIMFTSLLLAATLGTSALADDTRPSPTASTEATAPAPTDCIRDTGTHLPNKDGKCLPVSGQVLTADDLRHTGATSTADAIRALVPAAH